MILPLLAAFLIVGQIGFRTPAAECGKYRHPIVKCVSTLDNPLEANCHLKCADDLHTVTEREYQSMIHRLKELEEKTAFTDGLRAQQCPSLSWINGRCIPSCKDDPNGSCKPDPPKEQR